MKLRNVRIDVDVDIDDILDELSNDDIIQEVNMRGMYCSEHEPDKLSRDELDHLIQLVLKDGALTNSALYDKLLEMRFG